MIIHGIYEEKLRIAEQNKKIEYKFIPRTLYEEQMSDSNLLDKIDSIYDSNPWDEKFDSNKK
jgi:hypothetical protein